MKSSEIASTLFLSAFISKFCMTSAWSDNANLTFWSQPEEVTLCDQSISKTWLFCDGYNGEADDECKDIVGKLGGVDPICAYNRVCQFNKGGTPFWISSDCTEAGFDILRNCVNNLCAVVRSNTSDIGDGKFIHRYIGIPGQGVEEPTNITQQEICIEGNNASITACESYEFRNDFLKIAPRALRIGQLAGGGCIYPMDPATHQRTGTALCAFQSICFVNASGKHEKCHFDLYNANNSKAVLLRSFIGNALITENQNKAA